MTPMERSKRVSDIIVKKPPFLIRYGMVILAVIYVVIIVAVALTGWGRFVK